jgi:hypothetical protein
LDDVMAAVADRSAHSSDTTRLMEAVEPLARTCRYGDVRQRDTALVRAVVDGIVTRVCVGLLAAAAAIDDDAAGALRDRIDGVQRGIATLGDAVLGGRWLGAVAAVADQGNVHGLVAGRSARLAFDAGRFDRPSIADRLARVLSPAADVRRAASWLEGFLAGDAALLLHDADLLGALDAWVATTDEHRFDDLLPLLRRTFATFTAAERRQLGERLRRPRGPVRPADDPSIDTDRAAAALPRVYELLGVGR